VGLVRVAHGFDVAAEFPGVADSKKLSEKKRESLFARLEHYSALGDVHFAVILKSAGEIDERGIAVVIREAVAEGLAQLVHDCNMAQVLLDGSLEAPRQYAQKIIIKGDVTVPVISLASIAAKVTRDRLMCALAPQYAEYSFEVHKGYGTKRHTDAIRHFGLSDMHRTSYCKNFL
jgi:ribonuclease HII